jgi:hypothetical protein
MDQTVYVVTGLASQRPVAAFRDLHVLGAWLRSRQGTSMLLVRKMDGGQDAVVLCIHCILEGQERRSH